MVGLEIEAEVMGVMRLLESPWTPLIMNGGEGLESGVGVKPVKRVWESDSEFDSDVDAEREIDEADAWWRADILKVVEHVGSVSSNSQQQQQQQVQQQQVGHQRVVGFRESTYESAYTSSDEDASSEQSTEDELNVLLPPTARRARKGSARHRWSTMSLTRPVLAYHESFNKRNSISILDIDSSDDTEEDELIQSISRRSSYSSPVPFPPPPPRPMSSSTFSRGFLERIPEDDDYLDAQIEGLGGEIHAIGGAIGRRGAGDTIDMIALTDVESMSSVNGDVKSPVVEAGELQQEQQQQVADVVDRGLDYVQLEGLGGLSVTPMKGNHDSGIDLTTVESFVPQVERPSSRIDRPSSRLLWHQPQPAQEEKKTAEAPILTQDGELNNILWSGAVKPVVPDTTSTAQAVVADPELESVVWTGNVRSLKGSAKPTVAQLTPEQLIVGSPESVIFTGVVKSKKAPVTNAAQIQQQEQDFLADAESIMWKGSVKSKKGTKKMAQDLASNPQDAALEDAESIVWRGNVKSKKSTTQAAKSQAGGSYAGDDAESIVYRGPVKSRRGNTINESQAESYKDSPMDDAESIVWKGTVKSKKSTTRKAKSVFSGHGEEDSGDEVASVKPSQAFVMDEDLESVMWQGSVKSSTRAIPKLSTSLKQSSSLKQTAVWEGNGAKIAEQVVTSPTQQSGFGDFAKVPLPEPVTEASGFFSGILKPIVEAAKTPVPPPQPTPAEALKPDPKDQVKKMNSLSWFATGPIAEQQQQEQPYTRPTASSSWFNAAVDDEEKKKPIPPNNVKPKASSNWFTAALTGSAVEEEEEMAMFDVSNNPPVRPNPPSQVKPKASSSWFTPITNIFQAIADLVPEEEEASLQVANSTTETLFETTDFDGKKWQKSEPAPASVTLASATAGGKKERPSSFIRPARPASVIKKRPTSLLHPRPDSSMSIHVESVVEFDEEVKAPVQVPIPAPVQAVERPSRRVLPPAAVSDKNASSIKKTGRRCKSLDTRPAVTAPTFNRSRRHSISIADETLRQEIKPTFLAGIPQRNSVPSTLTAQAPAAITSPVQIDDSASESSSSHRSHLSTPPLLSDEEHILRDRPLTPSRRTTSAVPTAASPTNNNRIKKRGSVSSSLHSDYVAPTAPQTNRRKSSFKPLAYDSGITEDSPKVDQLAAAFENVMEAAIETPWHLVPKWLVIDEGEGGAAAATAQEEEQQHGDVVVIEG
ncbi:hypothetical protein BCR33DRAFT_369463 [Rhizoclosmatium globosum]|uniref:Uncharacterized protein n=1 Tax=Rhizoclosmatium globosum TaxID=329046 RepID=A0A1Y2BZ90_9FUNG|nr:hypothetical protein BCR33DRAFT_369463 [Rhizoclosmatium globosum]|eukprot:ORY40092.1 hypothetical protein BCR33DRAFT_369463 [Rhizoclosmatium globosum]